MEEKKVEFIKFDEGEIEAAKTFIITQLDEFVLPYIYEKNLMFSSEKESIYSEYLDISSSINDLLSSYNDKTIDEESKKRQLNSQLKDLYLRTKKLVSKITQEQEMGNGSMKL